MVINSTSCDASRPMKFDDFYIIMYNKKYRKFDDLQDSAEKTSFQTIKRSLKTPLIDIIAEAFSRAQFLSSSTVIY